jgi:hypothetical protein
MLTQLKRILILVAFFVIGLFIFYLGMQNIISTKVLKIADVCDAKVTSRQTDYGDGGDDSDRFTYTYTYTVNGKEYTDSTELNSDDYKTGDKIKIYYYKKNPNKSNVYSMSFMVCFVGFMFIATSLFALINFKNVVWGQDVNKLIN